AFRNRLGIAVALRNGGLLAVGRPGHYVSEPPRHPSQPTETMGRGMLGGATPRFVDIPFIEQTGIGPRESQHGCEQLVCSLYVLDRGRGVMSSSSA
ncbi:MAG: hypothetical protein KKF14_05755, partial [Alphaproteobacteria bacterium]|nr:hypothetical protein [Alphaproteobacteria bacterium]